MCQDSSPSPRSRRACNLISSAGCRTPGSPSKLGGGGGGGEGVQGLADIL